MSTESADATKPRVLVVDDSRVIRVAARKILKEEFEPLEAGDGEEAWEILTQEPDIALVLSDLSMPYLDGMGLLQRLRESKEERLSGMPMIIVTGAEDDDEAKTRAFAAGATDFLSKPFDSVQLLAHTRSHIRLQKTAKELKQTTAVLEENPATDPFTGLGNQRAFLERGQQALAHAIRHGGELALLLFQVDGFDKIFVQEGKAVGGAILKAVTAALHAEIRREDAAARISMARFGLVTCCADTEGARRLAMRVCQRVVAMPVTNKAGQELNFCLSASLVSPPINQTTRFEPLLTILVKRLERAIAHGNCIVADDQGTIIPITNETETDMTAAEPVAATTDNTVTQTDTPVSPGTASVSNKTTTAYSPPDLTTALALLERGDSAALAPYLDTLVRNLWPLLQHWNQSGQHGMDEALQQIHAQMSQR